MGVNAKGGGNGSVAEELAELSPTPLVILALGSEARQSLAEQPVCVFQVSEGPCLKKKNQWLRKVTQS